MTAINDGTPVLRSAQPAPGDEQAVWIANGSLGVGGCSEGRVTPDEGLEPPPTAQRLLRSFSATLAGQGLLLVSLLVVTRASASLFGPPGFGVYQVARRTLAVVSYPLMCGIGTSLPRYMARDAGNRRNIGSWLVAAAVVGLSLEVTFLGAAALRADWFGGWTFGEVSHRGLVFSLLIAIGGQFFYNLAYAALRGLTRFRSAAQFQVVNGAIVPIMSVLCAGGRVERALSITGIGWAVIGGAVFSWICRDFVRPFPAPSEVRISAWNLLVFGAPRVPGEIALFGLFALPVYAAVHRGDIVEAGLLSLGFSLIQLVGSFFAAAGFVLLPYWSRASQQLAAREKLRRWISILVAGSSFASVLGLAILHILLRPLTRLLVGGLADTSAHGIKCVTIGVVPYVAYLVLRDYLDAVSVFPLNTLALAAAISAQALLLRMPRISIPAATLVGFLVLGFSILFLWLGHEVALCGTKEN
jgi:O-antigen/teichoic acid export membrane protein